MPSISVTADAAACSGNDWSLSPSSADETSEEEYIHSAVLFRCACAAAFALRLLAASSHFSIIMTSLEGK